MFYTLASKFLITKVSTPRDYLYIFIAGSVGYVILHWYLHMEKQEGIVEKVREYLYYAMVIDVITAYVLITMYPSKSDKENNNEDTQNNEQPREYTPEEKKTLMQRMQEGTRSS